MQWGWSPAASCLYVRICLSYSFSLLHTHNVILSLSVYMCVSCSCARTHTIHTIHTHHTHTIHTHTHTHTHTCALFHSLCVCLCTRVGVCLFVYGVSTGIYLCPVRRLVDKYAFAHTIVQSRHCLFACVECCQ